MSKIIELLESDHRTVEQLLDRIEKAEGDERKPLLEELQTSLSAHMQIEEDHLYSLVARELGDEEAREAQNEHSLARDGLTKLLELGPDDPGFGAALDMVKAGIEHHVEDEEGEVFPGLREKAGDELRSLEPQVLSARQQLGLPTGGAGATLSGEVSGTATSDLANATKDELYERAKQADIPGRSQMTKDELVEALEQQS